MQPSYVSKEIKYDANLNEVKLYYFGCNFQVLCKNCENLYMYMLKIVHSLVKIDECMIKINLCYQARCAQTWLCFGKILCSVDIY